MYISKYIARKRSILRENLILAIASEHAARELYNMIDSLLL